MKVERITTNGLPTTVRYGMTIPPPEFSSQKGLGYLITAEDGEQTSIEISGIKPGEIKINPGYSFRPNLNKVEATDLEAKAVAEFETSRPETYTGLAAAMREASKEEGFMWPYQVIEVIEARFEQSARILYERNNHRPIGLEKLG